jgi:hypothetical protein
VEIPVVRDSILKSNWGSTNAQFKTAPLVLPHSKMKEVLESSTTDQQERRVSTKPWTRSESRPTSYTWRVRLRGDSNSLKNEQHT